MFERSSQPAATVPDEEESKSCLLFAFGCFCGPVLLIAILAYLVSAFIYLVRDYSVCSDRSTLWLHVLIVLIINAAQLSIQYTTGDRDEEIKWKNVAVAFGLNLVIVIYGSVILFDEDIVCEDMRGTGLWVVAHVMFWVAVSTTVVSMLLLGIAVYGYFTTGSAVIKTRLVGEERRGATNLWGTGDAPSTSSSAYENNKL